MDSDSPVKVLLSTSTFWFWGQPYAPSRCLDIIQNQDLKVDGVDIWFFVDEDHPMPRLSDQNRAFLAGLEMVSLHTDFYDLDWAGRPDFKRFEKKLASIGEFAGQTGADHFTIHGDMLIGNRQGSLAMLADMLPGLPISFEFMDADKSYGNHPDHFIDLFQGTNDSGLVVDIAHLQDFTRDFSWRALFEDPVLAPRITAVHLSHHTRALGFNFYQEQGFDDIEAGHTLCLAAPDRFEQDLLKSISNWPIILEGIIPPGPKGIELARREIQWLKTCGGTK